MHAAIVSRTHYDGVVDKVRRLLLRGPFGVHGIRELSRALGIYDDCATSDGAGAVDECGDDLVAAAAAAVCVTRDVFVAVLSSCGVVLTDDEVATVFAQLACSPPAAATLSPTTSASSSSDDAQRRRRSSGRGTAAAGDGNSSNSSGGAAVDAVLFVAALRTRLTPLRRAWVTRVWSMFAKERDDSVTLDTLYAAHRETAHAVDYATSNKDGGGDDDEDDDELREVAAAVGSFVRTFSTATNATGRVSADEFADYCAGVSSACSSDELFVAYMRRTWWWWWRQSPSTSVSVAASPYARQKSKSSADAAAVRADDMASNCRRRSGDADGDGSASLQHAVYTEHDTLARKQAVAHVRALRTRLHHLIEDVHRPSVMSSARRVRQLTLSLRRRDVRVRAAAGVPVECGFVTRDAFGDALRENRLYMTSPSHDKDDGNNSAATGTTMSSRASTIVTDTRNKSATAAAAAGTRKGSESDALPQQQTQTQTQQLLAALDTMGDGSVDYLYYLALLLPPLPPSRQVALSRLWRRVLPAKNARGAVDVYALQRAYCADAAAALDEFYVAWDVRCALDAAVRYDELLAWYIPQSAAVALDGDFVRTLAQRWRRVDA